jgi:ATP phosphoribosyltransferase
MAEQKRSVPSARRAVRASKQRSTAVNATRGKRSAAAKARKAKPPARAARSAKQKKEPVRRAEPTTALRVQRPAPPLEPELVVAIPKGRVLKTLAERFARAGVDPSALLADDRTLVRDDPRSGIRFLLLKPDDVPTYVEYGSADVGVVGRDVLMEREYDLYAPLDLRIGVCRLAVCGKPEDHPSGRGESLRARSTAAPLRVATKFATLARRHYLARGEQVDIVYVQGSVELAPLLGLSDVIVDLVESGETLRQNGLVEHETICEISSVIIANRVAFKLKRERIRRLLEAL